MVLKKSATVDVGEAGRLYCGHCGRVTNHRSVCAVHFEEHPDDDEPWVYELRLSIIQCAGCDKPSFLHEMESEKYLDSQGQPDITRQRFPAVLPGLLSVSKVRIPFAIWGVYWETRKALASDFRILAGVGIRAVIEALCKDHGIKVKDLSPKIDELVKKGLVTAPAAKVLHQLRFLGNAAAHEVKEHTTEELLVAMKVIDNILDNIYTLPRAWSEGLPSTAQP